MRYTGMFGVIVRSASCFAALAVGYAAEARALTTWESHDASNCLPVGGTITPVGYGMGNTSTAAGSLVCPVRDASSLSKSSYTTLLVDVVDLSSAQNSTAQ